MCGADFRAINLFAWSILGRLGIELAQPGIGLAVRIVIGSNCGRNAIEPAASLACNGLTAFDHLGLPSDAPDTASGLSALPRRRCPSARGGRGIRDHILDPFGILAAVALELGFDPIDSFPVAFGALASVAKLREALHYCLVFFQIQTCRQRLPGIVGCHLRNLHRAGPTMSQSQS